MGTSYELLRKDTRRVYLDEHSNKFDLGLHDDARPSSGAELDNLTVNDVVVIALELLKVMSHWTTQPQQDAVRGLLEATARDYYPRNDGRT